MKYTFLLIVKSMLVFYSTNASRQVQFYHRNVLVGHICQGNDVVFTTSGSSRIYCASVCSRHEICLTWFFGVQQCTGCSKRYNDTQALLVAGHMMTYTAKNFHSETCNNDVECKDDLICFTDKCVCVPGYYYDPNTKTCKTECTAYGDTYQDYNSRVLKGNNIVRNQIDTFGNCKAMCTKSKTCRSLDYDQSSTWCTLASATALSHSDSFVNSSKFIYSQRNCGLILP